MSKPAIHPFFQTTKKQQQQPVTTKKEPLSSPSTPSPSRLSPSKQDRPRSNYRGECSQPYYVAIEKPKFYSDSLNKLEYEQKYNFYGKIPTTTKRYEVSEFSQLTRDLFHVTDKPFETCSTRYDPPPTIDFSTLDPYQFLKKQHHVPKKRRSSSFKPHITNQQELDAFMDIYFPHWNTFPSCVVMSQSVWRKDSPNQQQWGEKYRPKHLNGLLGARYNYLYLKDWLHQMKIEPLSAPSSDTPKKKPTRRKKQKKIVVFDEYADEDMMRGLSLQEDDDDDDDFMLTPKKKLNKKPSMKSNIILLVGDHGVGKTAAVYTIAEQMEYQVFEINAGSKRSGKDIVSMVGEMTKSHLVTFHTPSIFNPPPQAPASLGKKKKLKPNFSPSAQLASQQKNGLLKHFAVKNEPKKKPTTNNTKQSLILLEEVDLLFEEDKGFWASVIDLSQKSKRPIVMTCNDPDQVPFEDLCIQSVLDIQPPSDSELLPYLWLICFAEGYLVNPSDLICLMACLGRDIRKLLQTLELYAGEKLFEKYLGFSTETDLAELKARCPSSRLAVDTFRLARFYEGKDEDADMEQEENFEDIARAMDTNAFIDSYLTFKGSGIMAHECVEDQLNGFTSISLEDDEDTPSKWMIEDIANGVSVLNTELLKSNTWNTFIMDEGSHWQELCDASFANFEDYREAIEKLLPLSLIYQPNEQVIMMDYIPQIQIMLSTDVDKKSRSTRSKRKRLYLPLNEDCVHTLNNHKQIVDETEIWIQRLSDLRSR